VDHYALIEVKHISRSEYEKKDGGKGKAGEALVAEKRDVALAQLARYCAAQEMEPIPGLKKWVLVFAGYQCVLNVDADVQCGYCSAN
jgi:hypothetical protein